MSKVYFTSDLHFGHANIIKFAGPHGRMGSNSEEHDEWLIEEINKVVRKRDVLWILGDVCMGRPGTKETRGEGWYHLSKIGRLNGTKKIVLGNHDNMPTEAYLQYAQEIKGIWKYKGNWISHAPMHPVELRGRVNIHGHVHHNTIGKRDFWDDDLYVEFRPDPNYINVCVEENLKRNGTPVVDYQELKIPTYHGGVKTHNYE